MSSAAQLTRQAEGDLDKAYDFYECERIGLGVEFLSSVERCVEQIERYPQAFPIVFRDVRRALVERFPFSIFYLADTVSTPLIIAVLHQHRDAGFLVRSSESKL